jgi:trehalose/maltose hydrolase-like predicted phosphorylase
MAVMEPSSDFLLVESSLDARFTKHYEGAFSQGSGYLHVRGSFEEGLAAAPQDEEYARLPANVTLETPRHLRSKWGTYVPGITGRHPLLREELVNLPFFLHVLVFADGEPLDMDRCAIEGYSRRLDMRDAVLQRRFLWKTRSGAVLEAAYLRFVSRNRPSVCVQEIHYRCVAGHCICRFECGIDARVSTNGYNHFSSVAGAAQGGRTTVLVTTDTGDQVALCSEARLETPVDGFVFSPLAADKQRPACSIEVGLRDGEHVAIRKISAVATTRDQPRGTSPQKAAAEAVDAAFADFGRLRKEHSQAWQELWKKSALRIEGDQRAQRAVNFSLYHLLRASNPDDSRVAICAKGFAGEAYFGHFFWDTEIYLLPFYLYTNPRVARSLLEFRLNTLDGARRNAALYGYRGARYPWESSVSGDEQCPNWQYADHEVHVTADVAHGIRHYFQATGDIDFLSRAAECLVETSRYWASRVEGKQDGSANLNGVMGPDEYTCFCNNNAYTNVMVARALRFTGEALQVLQENRPQEHAALVTRLSVTPTEIEDWSALAGALPVRERPDGLVMQCDHFEDLEDVDFHSVWKDRSRHFGQVVSQEKSYRSKALKQADVLMLACLFPGDFPEAKLRVNYDYYEPLTTHDSSLSAVLHSILAARLGRSQEAYSLFQRSLGIDLDPETGGAAEGIHIGNCAGIWQAIVMGFAGMHWAYESDELRFTPRLPQGWRSLEFPVCFHGKELSVRISHDGVDIQ